VEGRSFLEAREREENEIKEKKIKEKHNWDERIFRS
jgi:hypothetical protein